MLFCFLAHIQNCTKLVLKWHISLKYIYRITQQMVPKSIWKLKQQLKCTHVFLSEYKTRLIHVKKTTTKKTWQRHTFGLQHFTKWSLLGCKIWTNILHVYMYMHLADVFIQSDFKSGTKAIHQRAKNNRNMQCKVY